MSAGSSSGRPTRSSSRSVRDIAGELPILVPGVGAQGGDVAASVPAGTTTDGTGLLLSSSRAILYASPGEDFAEAARAVALRTATAIRDAVLIVGLSVPAATPSAASRPAVSWAPNTTRLFVAT